jgi:3-(3-hydroxy-phenyl)propionate hydroxylase
MKTDFDVIVVGLGPVGATLAALLDLCGISVLVLEREADVYPLPRAVHFDDEVMRVFQTIGIADQTGDFTVINKGMRFVDADGKMLLDWPRPQEIGPNGWYPSYRFNQPMLERLLRSNLEECGHVDVRLNADVIDLTSSDDSVLCTYVNKINGEHKDVSAAYIIGCDGANSIVREKMAVGWQDLGFEERWLVVDVQLKVEKLELGEFTIQHCDPARPSTFAHGPGMRRRWEFTLFDEEDSEAAVTDEFAQRLLSKWLNPGEAEIERRAVYTFGSKLANNWRKERMLVAGDAAHLMPPFMGQGMCTGIRDVSNLAWKLAAVVKDGADEKLLDTYSSERRPHAQTYIETAIKLGQLMNSYSRDAASGGKMESLIVRLGPGLGDVNNLHRGRLFPQPRLADGRLLDDVVGYRSKTVGLSDKMDLDANDHPELKAALEERDLRFVTIRPDRYVQEAM